MVATCRTDNAPAFSVGTNVYYFNQWADFEAKELHKFFTHLTPEEIFALKQGDVIWIDQEPYHRHGKVYGYTKITVTDVVVLENKSIRVSFGNGFTTFAADGSRGRTIAWVKDERALHMTLRQLSRFATELY